MEKVLSRSYERATENKLYQDIPDFLKFVGPSRQKITRTGNTAKYAGLGVFCFAPEIGNATGMPERSRSTRN
jgi:hypothetical protein